MSNNRPPILRMPGSTPPAAAVPPPAPPPPVAPPPASETSKLPEQFATVLRQFPLPWIVGPYDATDGTYMIFVADDIEPVKDDSKMNQYGAVFNGWLPMCPKPRLVVSLGAPKAMAELFVFAANKLAK